MKATIAAARALSDDGLLLIVAAAVRSFRNHNIEASAFLGSDLRQFGLNRQRAISAFFEYNSIVDALMLDGLGIAADREARLL